MSVTSYEVGEVSFLLFDTEYFHVETENERFTSAGLRCRQKLIWKHTNKVFDWSSEEK